MTENNNELVKELMESMDKFKKLMKVREIHNNFKHGERRVLYILKHDMEQNVSGIKVSTLSKLLGVTPSNITQIISGLEEREYISRTMDKHDRRAIRVKLTKKGEEEFDKCLKEFNSKFSILVDILGVEDSRNLINIINKIYNYFAENDMKM